MFLPDIGLYKVGLRLKASESSQRCEGRAGNSAKRCQEEEKASGSLSSSIERRIRIGSNSQWIIAVAILRLYNDSVPAPLWGPKIRLCIITKHVAACFCGIWDLCKEGLGLKASESSHRHECLLSSPVPSNFEGPSRQVSLPKRDTASRKNP